MKFRNTIRLTALLFAATLVISSLSSAQDQATPTQLSNYSVISLGVPLGGSASFGSAINNLGWAAGASNLQGDAAEHAVLWAFGLPVDLGTLGGPNSAVLWPGLNNFGQTVGVSDTSRTDPLGERWSCAAFFPPSHLGHTCVGFEWQLGLLNPLPTLGGNNGFATAINDYGQSVGWAETNFHDPTCVSPQVLQFIATLWGPRPGQVQALNPLAGDPDSAATGINDQGQAVGISGICQNAVGNLSAKHAVLWQKGNVMRIGDLGGAGWNTPMAISNRGTVVGFSDLPGDNNGEDPNFHAFLWSRSGGTVDLSTLPGDVLSEALGINQQGQVVGVSFDPDGNQRAFLWQNGHMTNLNMLVPSSFPYTLQAGQEINDAGVITGYMCLKPCTPSSAGVAFLAVPNHDRGVVAAAEAEPNVVVGTMPVELRRQIANRMVFGRIGSLH